MTTKAKTWAHPTGDRITFPPKADGGGQRKDTGKLRVDLIPADALYEVARVMTYGAAKYAERNWERGMSWSKVMGPLERHLLEFKLGRRVDAETGLPTIAHVACNALFLLAYELRGLTKHDDVEPFIKTSQAEASRRKLRALMDCVEALTRARAVAVKTKHRRKR